MKEPIYDNDITETDLRYYNILKIVVGIILLISMSIASYVVGYHVGTKNVEAIETVETTVSETEEVAVTEVIIDETIPETTEPTVENVVETVPEALSAPVTPETIPDVSMDEVEMLACVIYQEAGSDYICDDCRRRVADVVLNRVASEDFPDTMYEVLTARSQYGRFHWTGVVWPDGASNATEQHAVERAYRIAREVLNGQHSDLYGGGWIWQAEFPQGSEQKKCCGIYFGR